MYTVFSDKDSSCYYVVNNNHSIYNDYCMAEYKNIFEGTRKECLGFLEEIEVEATAIL